MRALIPGLCDLIREANGFTTIHLDVVVIEVNERACLDFALTIGSKTDNITVLEARCCSTPPPR